MAGYQLKNLPVVMRGAGEMASGVAYRLHKAGFNLLLTETDDPLAVRREVSFCEAVHDGHKTVEGVTGRLIESVDEAAALWARREIPVLVDPGLSCLGQVKPAAVVDAILAKRNLGTHRGMAALVIGLGPGFKAPDDVHLAVETNRGHNLGRLIYQGETAPNTGVPGNIAGYTIERVLRAPGDGVFEALVVLGDLVEKDQVLARVGAGEIKAQVGGVVRGLLRPGAAVTKGLKCGDVDPRGDKAALYTISEKARAIGGSVLEGIMAAFNR